MNDPGIRPDLAVGTRSFDRRSALRALLIPAGAAVLGGCSTATRLVQDSPAMPDAELGRARFEPDGTRTFHNHVLYDQDGRKVRFHDDLVRGQVFAASFGYVKCRGICGRMSNNMLEASDLLGGVMGKPVRFYNFSLAQDSPADMREAMEFRGVYGKPGWTYLTGSPEAIRDIRWSFGFFDAGEDDTQGELATHTGMIRFGNHPLDKWSSCPGLGNPANIARSVVWLFPSDRRPKVAGTEYEGTNNARPIPGWTPPAPIVAQG